MSTVYFNTVPSALSRLHVAAQPPARRGPEVQTASWKDRIFRLLHIGTATKSQPASTPKNNDATVDDLRISGAFLDTVRGLACKSLVNILRLLCNRIPPPIPLGSLNQMSTQEKETYDRSMNCSLTFAATQMGYKTFNDLEHDLYALYVDPYAKALFREHWNNNAPLEVNHTELDAQIHRMVEAAWNGQCTLRDTAK